MPLATRRNGQPSMLQEKIPPDPTPTPIPDTRPSRPMSRPSPYILLIYPIILATGTLFSILSPSASPPTYSAAFSPGVASDINTPQAPPTLNYFAGKQNIINLYFVKIGWFWTTLAFTLLQATTKINSPNHQPSRQTTTTSNHNIPQALLRYSLITLTWIITTQWFFGPALIDRSFTSTGGRCIPNSPASTTTSSSIPAILPTTAKSADLSSISTGLSCKLHNGTWLGGHDISGHFFMLVLSSAFLFFEFLISGAPLIPLAEEKEEEEEEEKEEEQEQEQEKREASAAGRGDSEAMTTATATIKVKIWTHYFVWTVILLDAWMLLMTAVWFHTLYEKVSGLVLAALSVWAVYFLPRWVEGWRQVVGGV